jgi:hypothetical protein
LAAKRIRPRPHINVSGRVLHAEKDIGIEGVTIWAVSGRQSTETDATGDFTLVGLTGKETLVFFQEGWTFDPNSVKVTGTKTGLVIRRRPAANMVEPQVDCGFWHTVALKSDGIVWTWGYNGYGQLGMGNTDSSTSPMRVGNLNDVVAVAAGSYHSLALIHHYFSMALRSDGSVWTWGANGSGQLGTGSTNGSSVPVKISGLDGVRAIATGAFHALALRDDGSIWAWGNNNRSQLGDGTTTTKMTPTEVIGIDGALNIDAGVYYSIALKSDVSV